MRDSIKNITIGSLVVGAIVLLTWVLLFLHPSFGDGKFVLHARFGDIEKVSVGSRVTYAGRPVGKVSHISFIPEEERQESSAPLYLYDVTLAIDSHVKVYDCDEVSLSTSGLMGERFIAIIPKRPAHGKVATALPSESVVLADKAFTAQDTFLQINDTAEKAEKTIELLSDVLEQNRQDVQATLKSFKSAAAELDAFLKTANEVKMIQSLARTSEALEESVSSLQPKLEKTLEHLQRTAESLESSNIVPAAKEMIDSFNKTAQGINRSLPQLMPKLDLAIDALSNASKRADQTTEAVQTIVQDVRDGRGSIGKLLSSDDFYFKTVGLMNKLDFMMNDINQYGILFHLDKGWQRERKNRVETVNGLKNPEEFKAFLNTEMNKVNSSLERLQLAFEKSGDLVQQQEFRKSYRELLAQLDSMQGTLKAYSPSIEPENQIADSAE